jgi:carbon storage regulator
MLILTRKVGQEIVIRDDIHLKVFKISGNRATIGIEAPLEVKVLREELLERQDDGKKQ